MQSLLYAGSLILAAAVSKPPAAPDRGLELASTGHCAQAVPILYAAFPQSSGDEAKKIGQAGVKCSLAMNDSTRAVYFLTGLTRRFPHDPAVLYLATHAYSDLSMQASNELLNTAPGSVEVHELNAEALETMGKWKEAAQEYQAILAQHPDAPGIHYRLGRLLLSQPDVTDAMRAQAKQQFEDELKSDPKNAGADFVLGELARQAEDWPTAIRYFTAATKNDASFFDAFLGLGRAYLGAAEYEKALPPLETAEKMQPENPEVHFQLANAYRRVGRTADATREAKLHQEMMAHADAMRDQMHQQITGSPAAPSSQ